MRLPHVVRALPELFRIGFAEVVAYRAEMVIWILSATMPIIMLSLWNAVVSDAPLQGFGPTEITRYFAATLVVRQLTSSWLIWKLNHLIRTGGLSPLLLRPMHPLVQEGATTLAAMPFRMVVLAPLILVLVAWRPELVSLPDPWALALFVPSVLLAWLLGFLAQAVFALLAFWLDQSQGIFNIWFNVWMLLSGYLVPLDLFPPALRDVLTWLPFRGMLAAPVELLAGLQDPAGAALDVGVQLGWIGVFGLLVAVLWRRGVARYGAYGA